MISPFTSVKDLVSEHAGSVLGWLVAEGPDVFASDKYTHKRTHTNARAHTHAHTHTHTQRERERGASVCKTPEQLLLHAYI